MKRHLLTILCIFLAVATGCDDHNHSLPAKAPSPTVDCMSLIFNMVDCMSFLINDGDETKLSGSCCSGFKSVVDTDAECVCEALESSARLGINVNMTKAIKLPSSCGVSSFKVDSCKVNARTTAAPPPMSQDVPSPREPPASPSGHAGTPPPPSGHGETPPPPPPSGHDGTETPPSHRDGTSNTPPPSVTPPPGNGAYSICATFSVLFSLVVSFLLS